MTLPASHVTENQKLSADGYVDLFEMEFLNSSIVRFKNSGAVTWQGNLYEHLGCKLSGVGQNADEQEARPSLIVANPEGVFSTYAAQGLFEGATVRRMRLLRQHLDGNNNIFQQRRWKIDRVANVTDVQITFELVDLTSGFNFIIPARMYMPPEFPVVNLS